MKVLSQHSPGWSGLTPWNLYPVHTIPPYLPKIQLNIILPSMTSLLRGLFPLSFSTKILYVFLISPMHATCPTHLIILDLITLITGEVHSYEAHQNSLLLLRMG